MSEKANGVKLGKIIKEFRLEVLNAAENYEKVEVMKPDVNRPGLPLTGFFERFDSNRLMVIGITEWLYLDGLTPEVRRKRFDDLMAHDAPALIITRAWSPTRSVWRWRASTDEPFCAPRHRPPLL